MRLHLATRNKNILFLYILLKIYPQLAELLFENCRTAKNSSALNVFHPHSALICQLGRFCTFPELHGRYRSPLTLLDIY